MIVLLFSVLALGLVVFRGRYLYRQKNTVLFVTVAMAALFTASCQNGTGGTTGDSIDWKDSALKVYLPLEHYYFVGEEDSLLMVAPQVLDFCREHEVWWVYYVAWERKAEMFVWQGEYDRATEEAEAMRQDAVKRGNDYGQALAYHVMAQGYGVQDNYDEAVRCYELAEDHYPDDANPSMLTTIYSGHCEALSLMHDYVGMDSVMQRWKPIIDSQSVTADDPQAYVLANWRYLYFMCAFSSHFGQKQYDAAGCDLDSATYYNSFDTDTIWNVSRLFRCRSQLALKQERYAEALQYADSAVATSQGLSDALLTGHLEHRSAALEGLGRYAEALADMKQFKTMNDSITRADNREQLNQLNKRFEVSELKMQAERKQLLLLIAIGAVVLVAIIIFILLRLHAARRLAVVNAQKERMEGELRIARDIQMSMVPSTFPQLEGLDMYATMHPAKEVGGDLYGYVLLGDKLYFAVGDVSGKGVPASLFMAQATRLFRTLAAQQMMPAEICTRMNDALSGEDNESGMFVTFFLGLVDLKTGHLDFCNAGHNPPVIGGGEGHGEFLQMIPNAPIGLWPGLEYEGEEIKSIKGRPLFIYTDGLNEAENRQQEQFGDDRLLDILCHTHFDTAQQVVKRLKTRTDEFRDGAEPNDDLTMMCLRIS